MERMAHTVSIFLTMNTLLLPLSPTQIVSLPVLTHELKIQKRAKQRTVYNAADARNTVPACKYPVPLFLSLN